MPGRTESEDVAMDEAPPSHQPEENQEAEESPEQEEEEEEEEETQRVRILPGSTDTAASFEFIDESHTIGNALRYVIMKNPDVEFCAYAIPHPSEAKMNVRIQTYDGTAVAALQKGLKDLQALSDTVAEEFIRSKDEFGRS
ncbi:DNA-directed RNA polymerases I and III subunit RPAC2 [Colletotrichum sidae]|uniref:DNA-directed RNA polymerases I and III subunit RPAC2 n=3 Tax=Colletotrichum orbiculare species complex TaxID=2707354 RepID=A0A4R8RYQ0_COLTR|nr:DNA-directed RNA polymerases I and III subunit RPAC2 [Colletotrichum spinosum]TDZ71789.1 DNA-directed RNA polymerases I and III subunit RPAC2 [Colletotrichum trifolii]TDZ87577.1 DNA-directed RNA polymerases I and III subunit RPAC2 [Colletotrichum sidae]